MGLQLEDLDQPSEGEGKNGSVVRYGMFSLMPYLRSKAKCSLRSNLENWTVQSEVTNNFYFVSRTHMLMTVSLWGELRTV